MNTLPELLAPAGDWNSLVAAIQNGANAVYLGAAQFSARQDAPNFSLDQLAEAVAYAHTRGCRIYVTVNTLISETEMPEAIRLAESLGGLGVDALIVQDLGLAANLRLLLPEIPLHASTQMTIHNSRGVELLSELGFTRVVLARELSLQEIAKIVSQSRLEMEIFVHGALCFSYSGNCLLSSMIGGRSGNRGRCAQPCRLEYSLVNSEGRVGSGFSGGPHLLSPKDLNTLEYLPDLVNVGVKSLKVEGRLKRPEYVATVVKAYRRALDHLDDLDKSDLSEMQAEVEQVFNRGFAAGYLLGNPGRDLMSYQKPSNRGRLLGKVKRVTKGQVWVELSSACEVGDGYELWMSDNGRSGGTIRNLFLMDGRGGIQEVQQAEAGQTIGLDFGGPASIGDLVYKNRENALLQQAGSTYKSEHEYLEIPVTLRVEAKVGKVCVISFTDPLHLCGTAKTEFVVEKALNYPISEAALLDQLNRLGNTPFVIKDYYFDLDPGIMVPKSELNQARRVAIDKLLQARLAYFGPTRLVKNDFDPLIRLYSDCANNRNATLVEQETGVSAVVDSPPALETALAAGADLIYLADSGFSPSQPTFNSAARISEAISQCGESGARAALLFSPIVSDQQMRRYEELISELAAKKVPFTISVGDYGGLQLARDFSVPYVAEPQLNTFNSATASFLACLGASQIHLSPELTLKQLEEINQAAAVTSEILVHGHQVVMVSKHCVLGSTLGGLTAESACKAPCRTSDFYGLQDRIGKVFPIRVDRRNCLMHLFNSVELCLVEHLPEIKRAGVSRIRIEGRLYQTDQLDRVIRRYVEGWRLVCDNQKGHGSIKGRLAEFRAELEPPAGITKGHLFRGVL